MGQSVQVPSGCTAARILMSYPPFFLSRCLLLHPSASDTAPRSSTLRRTRLSVGIDLGKHTFHLHAQDRHGKAVFRRKMSRKQLVEFFATFHTCVVVSCRK